MAQRDPAPLPPARGRGLMLDREREVASLDAALDGLERGEARTVLVEGRAGIGKSRLLAELRSRAETAGHRVLWARGSELERDFAFGVVRQLFEPLFAEPGDRTELLAGSAASAEPVLDPPADAGAGGGDASFAALHGLYWLTANAAGDDPLVIAVDDLHWVDHPSLRFLAYLSKRVEGLPVLLAVGMRPNEPGSDFTLLGEIAQDPGTVVLQPGPLDEDAIGAIVEERLGMAADRRFRAASHRATGGNPLLLHELVKTMAAEGVRPDAGHVEVLSDVGPRAVSRTVLLRLGRLAPEAALVARAVAVLGEGADLRSVARLAEVSEDQAADALGALARAEILRPEPPLGFAHPLLRDAVYRELPPGELERAHTRAAELLREASAPPEQVAAHLLVVPRHGDVAVVDLLVEAARRAASRGAAESSVAYLRRALEEPPPEHQRPPLLLELGASEIQVSIPDALTHMREAHASIDDPALRTQAAEGLARSMIFGGDPDEVVRLSLEAEAELPPEAEQQSMTFEALAIVARAFGADEAGLDDQVDRARERLRDPQDGPGARSLSAAVAWHLSCRGEEPGEAVALSTRALADGVLMATDPGFMTPVATASLIFADRPEVMDIWEEARATAHWTGSVMTMLGVDLWRGITLLHRGELEDAEESLRAAFDESKPFGTQQTTAGAYTVAFLSRVLLEQGKVAEARAMHELKVAVPPTSDGDIHRRRGLIELLLAEERFEEVIEAAEDLRTRLTRIVNPAIGPWRSLKAEALDRLGRTDEAVALAREELEPARRWGAPTTLGRALRVVGTLEREAGMAHLEEAVAVTEGTTARLEHAKALTALGAAIRRDRRPTDAREPLRRAMELAESCGATPLVETARSELYAAGSRPRSTALSGVDSLTPSERRVADLALEGKTNRDIAQALFVTPKTVEVHLSGAYRKLGIRSRRELAAALAPAA